MQAKIGVQVMMLKQKFTELGVYETLKKVSELGYHCIEVSQIEMTSENVAELKRASEDYKIEIAAISAGLEPMAPGMKGETLTTDYEKIVADAKALNCSFIRIGMLPFTCFGSIDRIRDFAKKCNVMAKRLKEDGIDLYYHNHHIEFQKYEGQYILDIIKEEAQDIGFELDVHWIQRGGEKPTRIIENYAGRVKLLHLKDYRIGALAPETMSCLQTGNIAGFMQGFSNVVEFAELGEGNLDFNEIIEAGVKSGAAYILIEQDDTYGRDPFDSLAISRDHLIKIGYESWF